MTARVTSAVTSAVVALVGLGVVGAVGVLTHEPWLFPSLGATLMVLAETPDAPPARPRNVLVGHGVALAAGWLSLAVTGLLGHPSALQEGIGWRRVAAAGLSLVVTASVVVLLGTPHPPAGATTLIVSLGILTTPLDLLVMAAAIVVVLVVGILTRDATTALAAPRSGTGPIRCRGR